MPLTVPLRYADPFEDYKTRLTKKLQAKGQSTEGSSILPSGAAANSLAPLGSGAGKKRKERDDVNWFGVKLGDKDKTAADTSTSGAGGGVGKYLSAASGTSSAVPKRPVPVASAADDGKKKRKLGFGNFDGW